MVWLVITVARFTDVGQVVDLDSCHSDNELWVCDYDQQSETYNGYI